ncbi:MAG: protein phosphatase 2C domain-containing protein [Acidimicrobiales bacterium]|jgi:protein phosphatase|nr:serine/threonine-protein phosphatase [Acidimicrobiia bacterium]HIL48322.1 serine/threonine-protein phosphatase [Acidimicrobiia bacterium]
MLRLRVGIGATAGTVIASRRIERGGYVRLEAGTASHTGRIRTSNQDSVGLVDGLYVVADGMGGHRGGEVASAEAVAAMLAVFDRRDRAGLVAAVRSANRTILEKTVTRPDLSGMGTTLCALAVVSSASGDEVLAVANIGDSRVYRFAAGELVQVSDDHSLVADLMRAGELSAEEAAQHPQRNILTRALGIEADPVIDSWELEPVLGDRYLLCSDGLFNELDDGRLAEVLAAGTVQESADLLVDEAVENGGHDNVTVLVIEVVAGPEAREGRRSTVPAARSERSTHVRGAAEKGRIAFGTALAMAACVVATAVLVLGLYARQGWFIGSDDGDVAVFRGRPSGLLWFDPTFVEGGDLRLAGLDGPIRIAVAETIVVGSLGEARRLIEGFRAGMEGVPSEEA